MSAKRAANSTARCPWCGTDPLYVAYHDEEWGVPVTDDRALFEKLVLDGFEAMQNVPCPAGRLKIAPAIAAAAWESPRANVVDAASRSLSHVAVNSALATP